jgi:hypothetical protein
MKTITNFLSAGVLAGVLCAGFAACNEPKDPKQSEEPEGAGILFTRYASEEATVTWVNLDGKDKNNVLLINSDEEMTNYVEGDYPVVDFSKNTLLIAYGTTPRGFHKAEVDTFSKTSDNKYRLDVIVRLYESAVIDRWFIAIVTDKIEDDSDIVSNVKFPDTWPE